MMRKAVSPIVATVLIILLTFVTIALVLTIGTPVIERGKEAGVWNEGYQNMRVIDNLITEVASEGIGSLRTATIKVTDGIYRTNPTAGTFEFTYTMKSGLIEGGTYYKEGNMLTIGSGRGAKASQNSSHIILENEILQVVLKKVGSEGNFANIYTNESISTIKIKSTGKLVNPVDTSIIIEGYANSSYGTGYSRVVKNGTSMPKAEALFHVVSTQGAVYEVLYTLPSRADFFIINVKNTTGNKTSVNFAYRLGTSHTDDYIKVPNVDENNITTITVGCYKSTQMNHHYICSHDNNTLEFPEANLLALMFSGKSSDFVEVCVSNYSATNYRVNLTANGEAKVIVPFTNGSCSLIDDNAYIVEDQGMPSKAFTGYDIGSPGEIEAQIVLEYNNIKIEGTSRFGQGTHRVCVEKTAERRLKAVVSVTEC